MYHVQLQPLTASNNRIQQEGVLLRESSCAAPDAKKESCFDWCKNELRDLCEVIIYLRLEKSNKIASSCSRLSMESVKPLYSYR